MEFRAFLTGVMVVVLAGCSGPNTVARNVQTGETLNALAGVPGAGIVGLAAMAVDVVSGALSSNDMDGGGTRSKQFAMSKKLVDALSNDPGVMAVVLDSQEKFKRGEWGEITAEQLASNQSLQGGKGSLGRYLIPGKPALIIVDYGNEYKSRFEDEPEA